MQAKTVYGLLNAGPKGKGYSAALYKDHESLFTKIETAARVEEKDGGKVLFFDGPLCFDLKESEYGKVRAILKDASGLSGSTARLVCEVQEYLEERPLIEDEKNI